MIREVSVINTYIGIGYGKQQMKLNLTLMRVLRWLKVKNDAAYVVFENGEIMGPLKPNPTVKEKIVLMNVFIKLLQRQG